MHSNTSDPLMGVEVFAFDVFGTVVDSLGTGVRDLKAKLEKSRELKIFVDKDWKDFMKEWILAIKDRTISAGERGPEGRTLNADEIHRELLDEMLASDRWRPLGEVWGEDDRREVVMLWHKLDGWPDSSRGLKALRALAFTVALSNGNVRLLADMAKHANLAWDVILSAELLGGFKPLSIALALYWSISHFVLGELVPNRDPKVYLGALHHLSVEPERCALVAAHIYDLRAAASHGMKTVYVRRLTEDEDVRDLVKTKREGGEVDVVVNGLDELADLIKAANPF